MERYRMAYPGVSDAMLKSMVNEEIFCDMFGGIDAYGTHASKYTALARLFVQQYGIARFALKKMLGRQVTDAEAFAYLSLEERSGEGQSAA